MYNVFQKSKAEEITRQHGLSLEKLPNHKRIYTYPADFDYVMQDVEERIEKFLSSWETYKISRWEPKEGDIGLIYRAGSFVDKNVASRSFKTPQSMRNVDLECKGIIAYPMQRRDKE